MRPPGPLAGHPSMATTPCMHVPLGGINHDRLNRINRTDVAYHTLMRTENCDRTAEDHSMGEYRSRLSTLERTHSVGRSRTFSISDAVWESVIGSGRAAPSKNAADRKTPRVSIKKAAQNRVQTFCDSVCHIMNICTPSIAELCTSMINQRPALFPGRMSGTPVASSRYAGTTGTPFSA